MGTTLTGTKPKDTYDSLIKVEDNGPISGTAKYLSDGLGNNLPIAVSTSSVGIGTSAPAKNLVVSASTDATLRLNSASSAVTSSDILGAVEFFANDSSADGTGIAASINASPDNAFGQGGMLRFNTRLTNAANAIERMRITNEGYVRLATGGIQFNGDTAAANALDDYEEGTFTPTVAGSTSAGTATYAVQVGKYTKIGRQVSCQIDLGYNSGTGTGNLTIAGLPFADATLANPAVTIGYLDGITLTASNYAMAYIASAQTRIDIVQIPVGGGALTSVAYNAAGRIIINVTYFTA